MKYAIGIDIGGTTIKLALIGQDGRIGERITIATSTIQDKTAFFQSLFLAINDLWSKQADDCILTGIGVGAPSVNEKKGTIEDAANLPFTGAVPFVKILHRKYGLPVYLVKDSNAATLGELKFGAARGMKNFILLTLGTGLGCGVLTNGKLLSGEHGHASEAGHVCVNKFGRECGCGRRGCLETYVSATGLKRTVFQLMGNTLEKSSLRKVSFDAMTSRDVYEAAKSGDPLAIKAFHYTGEVMGQALADMAAWFEPEAVLLSGGLAGAGDLLLRPTVKSMEKHLLTFQKQKISVRLSALGENDAALLGAASLVWSAEKC